MLEMFFQLIHAQHGLRFVVSSALVKEFYKFSEHSFRTSLHLYPPWWMSQEWQTRRSKTIESEEEEDFYEDVEWNGGFEDLV